MTLNASPSMYSKKLLKYIATNTLQDDQLLILDLGIREVVVVVVVVVVTSFAGTSLHLGQKKPHPSWARKKPLSNSILGRKNLPPSENYERFCK